MSSGEVDTSELEERADEVARLSKLAATICRTLLDKVPTFGRLNARDLWLMLTSSDELATSSEAEIQTLLDTLASPLIGALACDTSGYMTVMSPKVIQTRFTSLGQTLHSED